MSMKLGRGFTLTVVGAVTLTLLGAGLFSQGRAAGSDGEATTSDVRNEDEDCGLFWSNAPGIPIGEMAKSIGLTDWSEEHARLEGVFARALGQESKTAVPGRNRLVRVVTVSQDGLSETTPSAVVDATLARLEEASVFQPDIACLPEAFTRGEPETLPSPTAARVGAWARKRNCYVICPLHVREGDRQYNSALVIDRKGEVIGRYDKIRPTEGELKKVSPGALDPPVFQTDFGVIGIQICFDVNWHEQWRRLKEKGAQIVFFPAAYPAARHLAAHAWQYQYFVVSSTRTRPASIFDITGEKLETTGMFRQWAGAVLPVGKRLFEIDFHLGKMRQIERKYGPRVRVTWYHDDDLVTLASLDPDLTVDTLIGEYGLTPLTDYIQRAQKAQDAQRPAGPQPK